MAQPPNMSADASRHCRRLRIVTLGLTVFTVAQAVIAAGVYWWVDEQGNVHYGDRPPRKANSTPVEIEAAPTRSPENERRRAKTQRRLDAMEPERAQAQAKAAQAAAEQARKARNCEAAYRKMAFYERANSLFRRGPVGERLYLSDEERAGALSQARFLADQWCK